MDASAFSSSSPGRLVPTVAGAVAFVPEPIPRRLTLDLRTVRLLAEAQHRLGKLGGATGRLVNPWLVAAPFLRQEAILSSRIEGTITSPEQLALFEIAGSAAALSEGRQAEDTREVVNFVRATQFALDQLESLPVSVRMLREVHRILMAGVRGDRERPGELRDSQNFIGTSRDIADARFVPPPHTELGTLLADFEQFVNDPDPELPLLLRIALAHYQFEAIHPFRDGNGRIGRLLPLLLLLRDRVLTAPLLPVSTYLERNRATYMDLLLDVSTRGAWVPWVQFFIEGISESATDALAQVEAMLALRERWHARFQEARSSALLLKLVDSLFQSPAVTIARAAELLGITPAAATGSVMKLVEAGILVEVTGRKRDRVFLARDVLSFMRGDASSENSGRQDSGQ